MRLLLIEDCCGPDSLTRALGPLAGKVEDAVNNNFDPTEFFKGVTAQLFGCFDLFQLLPTATLDQNAPKMRTRTEDVAGGKLLIATLDWEPTVKNLDLGVAAFEKDHGGTSHLKIHGTISTKLDNSNITSISPFRSSRIFCE